MRGEDQLCPEFVGPVLYACEIIEAVCIYDQSQLVLFEKGFENRTQCAADADTGAERHGIVLGCSFEDFVDRFCRDSTRTVLRQGESGEARLNRGDYRQNALGCRYPHKTGAGPQSGATGKSRGTAHPATSGDDADSAEIALVSVGGSRL